MTWMVIAVFLGAGPGCGGRGDLVGPASLPATTSSLEVALQATGSDYLAAREVLLSGAEEEALEAAAAGADASAAVARAILLKRDDPARYEAWSESMDQALERGLRAVAPSAGAVRLEPFEGPDGTAFLAERLAKDVGPVRPAPSVFHHVGGVGGRPGATAGLVRTYAAYGLAEHAGEPLAEAVLLDGLSSETDPLVLHKLQMATYAYASEAMLPRIRASLEQRQDLPPEDLERVMTVFSEAAAANATDE